MKTLTLGALLFATGFAFGQKVDSLKVKELEKHLQEFKLVVKLYSDKIANSSNLDSIKNYALELHKQSKSIIQEINTTFKINNNYLIEYGQLTALANTFPNLTSFYQTQANLKLMDGLNQQKPNYYKTVTDIYDLAGQISKTKRIEKAQVLNNKIVQDYKKLLEIQ